MSSHISIDESKDPDYLLVASVHVSGDVPNDARTGARDERRKNGPLTTRNWPVNDSPQLRGHLRREYDRNRFTARVDRCIESSVVRVGLVPNLRVIERIGTAASYGPPEWWPASGAEFVDGARKLVQDPAGSPRLPLCGCATAVTLAGIEYCSAPAESSAPHAVLGEARGPDVPNDRIVALKGPQDCEVVLVTVDLDDIHPTVSRPHRSPPDGGRVRIGLDKIESALYPFGERRVRSVQCIQGIARGGGHMQRHPTDSTPSGCSGYLGISLIPHCVLGWFTSERAEAVRAPTVSRNKLPSSETARHQEDVRQVSTETDFQTSKSAVIELDDRRRASLGKFGRHDRYLVSEQEDGTLILEPAIVLTEAEAAYLRNTSLVALVEEERAHPERNRLRTKR